MNDLFNQMHHVRHLEMELARHLAEERARGAMAQPRSQSNMTRAGDLLKMQQREASTIALFNKMATPFMTGNVSRTRDVTTNLTGGPGNGI